MNRIQLLGITFSFFILSVSQLQASASSSNASQADAGPSSSSQTHFLPGQGPHLTGSEDLAIQGSDMRMEAVVLKMEDQLANVRRTIARGRKQLGMTDKDLYPFTTKERELSEQLAQIKEEWAAVKDVRAKRRGTAYGDPTPLERSERRRGGGKQKLLQAAVDLSRGLEQFSDALDKSLQSTSK